MTLSPDEVRDALEHQHDAERHATSLGNQLTGVALVGLGWLPAFVGGVARIHDADRTIWLWLGLLLSVVLVAASAIVSGRDRKHDRTFATFWTTALVVDLAVLLGGLGWVWARSSTGSTVWVLVGLLVIAPLVGCLGLLATSRTRH